MTRHDRFLRLVVMRHAKSSWASEAATDHERPLNARGRDDAPLVADRLVELGWVPDHVLLSDSRRTQETWSRMADRMPGHVQHTATRRLYHASIEAFTEVVGAHDDEERCLLVLGHNPGWEEVVQWLCGESVQLTTANAALLRRDPAPWDEALAPDSWGLVDLLRPKQL
jgi:phosphohistidine phosphatase